MYKNKQINNGMCTCMAQNRQVWALNLSSGIEFHSDIYPGTQTGNEANIHVNQ